MSETGDAMNTQTEPNPTSDMRPGEVAVPLPQAGDAVVYFIGRISTPWASRAECPKRGDPIAGPVCRIDIADPWREAIAGIDRHQHLQVLYWMHLARRDLVRQSPRSNGQTTGTFALRSPVRPNPIASAIVQFIRAEGSSVFVRGLDCVDGTPLIDLKPERCAHDG
jgi:tRNA-Thr(GGU) m(6)t(6)A37 methyltransferase TsaA